MGKITSLRGTQIDDSRQPVPECVSVIEEWLEKAKSGEIVGIAGAAVYHDDCVQHEGGGRIGSYSLIGCIYGLLNKLREIAEAT